MTSTWFYAIFMDESVSLGRFRFPTFYSVGNNEFIPQCIKCVPILSDPQGTVV